MRKFSFAFIFTFTTILLFILLGVSDSKLSLEFATKAEDVRNRATDWLTSQRRNDYGWGGDTCRVVTAVASTLDDWPMNEDLEARLSTKQLEIDLLGRLLRNGTDPIPPGRLALYILSLNAICKDSKDFHGYNLIDALGKYHAGQDNPGTPEAFTYSLSSLATCMSDGHIRKHRVRHLLQILRDDNGEHAVDTRATASLALECVRSHRHSDSLNTHVLEGLEALADMQKHDGSFGNIHSTALAVQGFASSGCPIQIWNGTAALHVLISKQDENGSFDKSIQVTTNVILAMSALLNGSGLLRLKRNRCKTLIHHQHLNLPPLLVEDLITNTSGSSTSSTKARITTTSTITTSGSNQNKGLEESTTALGNQFATDVVEFVRKMATQLENPTPTGTYRYDVQIETTSELTRSHEQGMLDNASNFPFLTENSHSHSIVPLNIFVKYWLWIGHEPLTAIKHNLTLRVSANTTFFQLMLQAAQISEAYEFSSSLWPNGHYIHTISGQREQAVGYHYWLLYRLLADPDPNNPPSAAYIAPGGVDELIVADGEIYMYWFKRI